MNAIWLALATVLAGGMALAVQAPLNSALSRAIGDSVLAAAISFGAGFVVLATTVLLRSGPPKTETLANASWWMFAGGALGAFYVWAALWGVSRLGVVTMTAMLVTGQLVAAMVIDKTGAIGLPVSEISWQRVAAAFLVGAGVVLSRF